MMTWKFLHQIHEISFIKNLHLRRNKRWAVVLTTPVQVYFISYNFLGAMKNNLATLSRQAMKNFLKCELSLNNRESSGLYFHEKQQIAGVSNEFCNSLATWDNCVSCNLIRRSAISNGLASRRFSVPQ